MTVPARPKLYHIVHKDRLPSIICDAALWCDAEVLVRSSPGPTIGMQRIKQRRLTELQLQSHTGLYVGQCVPFYFCPRSVMLYLIHKRNDELVYQDGQRPIVHLEFDLHEVVGWCEAQGQRWAFTLSNAGSRFFEDRCDLQQLDEIDWNAVHARSWQRCKDQKQAEFLVENSVPWHLTQAIGTIDVRVRDEVETILADSPTKPIVNAQPTWYY